MASSVKLFALSLAVLFAGAFAAKCNFTCGPNYQQTGYFFDKEGSNAACDFLASLQLNPNVGLPDYLKQAAQDPQLKNPERDCYLFCEYHNNHLPAGHKTEDVAFYWMYGTTCEADGGQCYCFAQDVCKEDRFDPKGNRPGDYENFITATNYTVGALCEPGKNKGDPHFTGGDGSHYDFSGVPNVNYAIISDAHLQVNGFFGGRYDRWGKDVKALTWIRKVGILFGHHTLMLEARTGGSAEYERGYMGRIVADGNDVEVTAPGTAVALWEGASIEWVSARLRSGNDLVDVYEVRIGDVATLRLTLRPEVATLRTKEDGTVHFGLEVVHSSLSPAVHGVLGQTYRPDFRGRLAQQKLVWSDLLGTLVVAGDNAEGFIDGRVDDYQVTGLLTADCKLCRFTRAESVDSEAVIAIDMLGGASGGGLSAAPRKFLDVE